MPLPSASTPADPQSFKVGENPVKKETAEFEKVKPARSDLVHAGEAPTKKDTAALEPTLPSWLRSLRKGDDSAQEKPAADESLSQDLPLGPTPGTPPDSSGETGDWLSGLGKAASEEEEQVPDWLASMRNEKAAPDSEPLPEPGSNTEETLSAVPDDTDWAKRMGGEPQPAAPGGASEEEPPSREATPDWLESLKSEAAAASGKPAQPQEQGMPDWISGLSGIPDENQPAAVPAESLPDWLEELKEKTTSPEPAPHPEESVAASSDIPDWLEQLKEKATEPEPTPHPDEGVADSSEVPDWLSNYEATPQTPETSGPAAGENIPEWLSDLEAKTGPKPESPAPVFDNELPPASPTPDEPPDWLSKFQSDVNAAEEQEAKQEQFEAAPPPETDKGASPLPDWLAGINPSATSSSDGTPALIVSDEGSASEDKQEEAFSLETPDWLSKLTPETPEEKAPEGNAEPSTPEELEQSELPSWVQAMRPVESVVSEAKNAPQEDSQATEQSGPLAGLRGVLPATPGLGLLRKPPAYSTILQVTDGQQRYAAAIEKLIASESQPQAPRRMTLVSNRLWRWLIAVLLILAVALPLVTGIPTTPASSLQPPEMLSAFNLILNLPANAPVLVVFDYEPALSGELEAAAAPLMDHLLLQGPRLALISTNPTGPALAERFMTDASASPLIAGHNYQAGQEYVNLGYLAGGPSGVLYFSISPTLAAPFSLDGQKAWQLPPLQGIQKLSDFDAIIVLTDNADSGRVWIEQTGSALGNTPILMVISAQAEPMLLPYYDSGQIKGLVTGLAGGEAYGQTFIRPDPQTGLAEKYWNSFGTGILVAELLIVIGAVWSAISGRRKRGDKSGEGV